MFNTKFCTYKYRLEQGLLWSHWSCYMLVNTALHTPRHNPAPPSTPVWLWRCDWVHDGGHGRMGSAPLYYSVNSAGRRPMLEIQCNRWGWFAYVWCDTFLWVCIHNVVLPNSRRGTTLGVGLTLRVLYYKLTEERHQGGCSVAVVYFGKRNSRHKYAFHTTYILPCIGTYVRVWNIIVSSVIAWSMCVRKS